MTHGALREEQVAEVLVHREVVPVVDRLVTALLATTEMSGVMVVPDRDHLLALCRRRSPRLILLGLEVVRGPELISQLHGIDAAVPVLVVGDVSDTDRVVDAFRAGARGFLRRDAVADLPLRPVDAGLLPAKRPRRTRVLLSPRELAVLEWMSEGWPNSEIARAIYVSEQTVKACAHDLFRKVGARDRADAVATGFRLGLLR